jgi:hypothetical protein
MATEPKKDDAPKAPETKTTEQSAKPSTPVFTDNAGDVKSHASKMVGYRGEQVGAKQAATEAAEAVAKADAEAVKNATPVGEAAFNPNPHNQVPQEGALVETPPQPVPPSYTDAELREMDHAPEGLREPSVAAKSTDTDQTVHPKSRVDDPSKPL